MVDQVGLVSYFEKRLRNEFDTSWGELVLISLLVDGLQEFESQFVVYLECSANERIAFIRK